VPETLTQTDPALSAAEDVRPMSIIVADDVPGITELVQVWLEESGHHVTCAASGNEVTALLRQRPADLIITDVIMPDGDGLEVMLEVKKTLPNARVVAMSGGGAYLRSRDCLNLAKGLGAHAMLLKPFDRDQLFAAIKAACADLSHAS
jgi:two-component system chemotaxis response regulator CheY